MRTDDPRYDTIKPMMNEGMVQTFKDIFRYIAPTVIAKDLGKKPSRFTQLIMRPGDFTVEEVRMMAEFCNMTAREMFALIDDQLLPKKSE